MLLFSNKTAQKTMIGFLFIIFFASAQQNFLDNANVDNLTIDRIQPVQTQAMNEIQNQGTDFWFSPILNKVYSNNNSFMAEVHTENKTGRVIGVWLVDTINKIEKKIMDGIVDNLKWSPSGEYLAFLKFEYVKDNTKPKPSCMKREPLFNTEQLCIFKVKTNTIDTLVRTINSMSLYFTWSPTNNNLAYSYLDPEKQKYLLVVFDAPNAKTFNIDELLLCDLWNFDWSPNGNMIIYTKPLQVDRTINDEFPLKSEIFIADPNGKHKKQLTNTQSVEIFVKWMYDGVNVITEIVQHPDQENYSFEYYNITLKKLEEK